MHLGNIGEITIRPKRTSNFYGPLAKTLEDTGKNAPEYLWNYSSGTESDLVVVVVIGNSCY